MAQAESSALSATQAALAAEHAAVYGYGVVGGLVGDERAAEAREAYEAHRSRRDALRRRVRRLGAAPVAAAAGYELPFPVTDRAAAERLAAELENRLAGSYADLVLVTTGDDRRAAAESLRDAALRACRWGGASVPFPGLAEYADTSGASDGGA